METNYRLQIRKFSSNVIEKCNDGKWSVFLIPTSKKVDGDIVADNILKFYQALEPVKYK